MEGSKYRPQPKKLIVEQSLFIRDYTKFFPKRMDIHALFDDKYTEELLNIYSKDKRFSFEIHEDWKDKKSMYFKNLEKEVLEKSKKTVDFKNGETMDAKGVTKFLVERDKPFSQKYKVIESNGMIETNELFSKIKISTKFSIQKKTDINISLSEMLFNHTFMIFPEYLQTYVLEATDEINFELLIACTKVRFFPWIDVGNSLYLKKDGDKWYPIGYCEYNY